MRRRKKSNVGESVKDDKPALRQEDGFPTIVPARPYITMYHTYKLENVKALEYSKEPIT